MTFTREQIEKVGVGSVIAWGLGDVPPTREYEVVEILAKREDIAGNLFVHGYFRFGESSTMSFSIKEGDSLSYKLYRIK